MTSPSSSILGWATYAREFEAFADKTREDGGALTEWWQTRDGLRTYSDLVLYCWIKHREFLAEEARVQRKGDGG